MTIKVTKVADIVGNKVVTCVPRRVVSELAAKLTNFQPADDPIPESAWLLELLIGEGPAARLVKIDLPPLLSNADPTDFPVLLQVGGVTRLVYFRDRLFMPERPPTTELEREEVILRVKKATYDEEVELSSLRAAVVNLEATIEFQKSGPKRDPIPADVKLLVWARDGGSCVYCGSKQDLHFDHIIPVTKGGGNSDANIQILCQTCNLKKSDKIA